MSQPVIKVEGLWKEYTIGAAPQAHARFYDLIAETLSAPLRRMRKLQGQAGASEQFWALRDINFEVQPGEVLGIIGRNGAGKSTLLKILSRITAPTRGRLTLSGRMASLLEVGTGFHQDLSGRENIFLNGAILGMSRQDIHRKFAEIVEFSGVEKFIDTPVKHYSSGMFVRLAFAVAAHLEPEILVIDEVLAVGDAEFQNKCLGKMKHVANEGRTVLFVSHNLGAVQALCTRALLLDQGRILATGDIPSVISTYLGSGPAVMPIIRWGEESMPGVHGLKLEQVRVFQEGEHERPTPTLVSSEEILIELTLHAESAIRGIDFGLVIKNSLATEVVHAGTSAHNSIRDWDQGTRVIQFVLPKGVLRAGVYSLTVAAMIPNSFFFLNLQDILKFEVEFTSSGWFPHTSRAWLGITGPEVGEWKIKELESIA
jgi:lipopolysaccharide transport system ATP-binding protein